MRTRTLALFALLAAAGCDAGTITAGPDSPSFAKGVPGNLPSATGHAEIEVDEGGETLWQKYSFTAQRVGKNQRVHGQWELKQDLGGDEAALRGRVTCFVAVDSMARLAGVVDHSDDAAFQRGSFVVWKVVDEGEGTNEPRDQASVMRASADPESFCGGDTPPMTDILSGNIQVHGFQQDF